MEMIEEIFRELVLNLNARFRPEDRFELEDDRPKYNIKWFVRLLNAIGIPKGFVLQEIKPEIQVGTLEGYMYD